MEQFDLFSPIVNDVLFQKAKILKEEAQKISEEDFNKFSDRKNIDYILVKTSIDQIKEKDYKNPPDFPATFIRKIKTVIEYKKEIIYSKENLIQAEVNKLYFDKIITMKEFVELCKQIYSLEVGFDFFNSNKSEKIRGSNLLIIFDHKINFEPNLKTKSGSIINLEKRSYQSLIKLIKIANKNKWQLIGAYEDFTKDADLIKDFDLYVNNKNYRDLFANDYLFLNNNEFFSTHFNTHGWPYIILSPLNTEESYSYFYIKKGQDGRFIRFEVFDNYLSKKESFELALGVEDNLEFIVSKDYE